MALIRVTLTDSTWWTSEFPNCHCCCIFIHNFFFLTSIKNTPNWPATKVSPSTCSSCHFASRHRVHRLYCSPPLPEHIFVVVQFTVSMFLFFRSHRPDTCLFVWQGKSTIATKLAERMNFPNVLQVRLECHKGNRSRNELVSLFYRKLIKNMRTS